MHLFRLSSAMPSRRTLLLSTAATTLVLGLMVPNDVPAQTWVEDQDASAYGSGTVTVNSGQAARVKEGNSTNASITMQATFTGGGDVYYVTDNNDRKSNGTVITVNQGSSGHTGTTVFRGATVEAAHSAAFGTSALLFSAASNPSGFTFSTLRIGVDLSNNIHLGESSEARFDVLTPGFRSLSGAITGSGTFRKLGGNTLHLTSSATTHSGQVIVDQGGLVAQAAAPGGAGAIGDSASVIVNGGSFWVNAPEKLGSLTVNAGHVEFNARADIIGSLTVNGGIVQMDVSSTAGALALNAGTVIISNSNMGGAAFGSLSGAGTIRFERLTRVSVGADNQNTTFAGAFETAANVVGIVEKAGSGRLTLTGNSSSFNGIMEVDDGELEVNGILGGSFELSNRGHLSGSGTLGPGTVQGGVVAPGVNGGNAIGTLTTHEISFWGGSVYEVTINAAGQSDLISVEGASPTNLSGATVSVQPQPGAYRANTRYTILTTTPTSSFGNQHFAGVTTPVPFAFLSPVLSYNAENTEVYLTLTGGGNIGDTGGGDTGGGDTGGGDIGGSRGTLGFNRVAVTPNQFATATAADRLGFGHQVFEAIAVHTAPQARAAFDALSGEVNASAASVASSDVSLVKDAVLQRLRSGPQGSPLAHAVASSAPQAYSADLPSRKVAPAAPVLAPRPAYSLWAQGVGARGRLEGDGNAATLTRDMGGLVIGADVGFEGRWRAGFAGAWTRSSFDANARLSSGDLDTYSGTLYGSAQFGSLAVRGGLSYAHHEVDTDRTILFAGYSGAVGTSFSGHSVQAFSELGYSIQLANLAIEPFAGLAHVSTDLGGFVETGDAAALAGRLDGQDVTYSSLGVRVAVPFGNLTARAGLSWRHAFGDVRPSGVFAFTSNLATPFAIAGTPIARDTLAVETGLDWIVSPNVALGVRYDGQFADKAREHAVQGSLRVNF